MRRTTGRRRRETRKWIAVCGVAAVIFSVLAGVGWLYLKARSDHPDVVVNTNCPEAGAVAITAIVVDRTDTLSPITRADARAQILTYAHSVPRFGKLLVFGAGADENDLLTPAFAACNPGSRADVSEFTSQIDRVQTRFEREYDRPLLEAIDRLLDTHTAPQSPIVEGIQAVTVAAFPPETQNLPRHLVVVSDLLQNSRRLSMYRGNLSSPAIDDFTANLTGVRVDLLIVEREQEHALQNTQQFEAFWLNWFSESGALVRRVLRLSGRN